MIQLVDRPDSVRTNRFEVRLNDTFYYSACRYVDEVIPCTTVNVVQEHTWTLILTINPDIRIVGEEYKDVEHTGKGLSPAHYNKRRHSFSSTDLRESELKKSQ